MQSCQPASKRAIVIADLGGGGSQRVAVWLAAAWLRAGLDVAIITLSGEVPDETPWPIGARRIALGQTSQSGNPLSAAIRNVRRVLALRHAIRESGANEVVSFLTATNVLTILACRGTGVTLVVSERNDPTRQRLGLFWELLRRGLYRFADGVTANSRQAMASLKSYVAPSKLMFVPNPLPEWPDEPPPAEARELVVLAVGRLHMQKGYDRLLPIFAASKAHSLGWRLVILGEGSERRSIERLRDELGLAACVSLPGHQANIKSWYDRAAIFMMMSRYEGTPNALIEAVSRGVPVIVSRTSGDGPAYIEDLGCGFVVDAENTAAGAAALDRLAADTALRRRLGTAGRVSLAKIVSADAIAAGWERALNPAVYGGDKPAAA